MQADLQMSHQGFDLRCLEYVEQCCAACPIQALVWNMDLVKVAFASGNDVSVPGNQKNVKCKLRRHISVYNGGSSDVSECMVMAVAGVIQWWRGRESVVVAG